MTLTPSAGRDYHRLKCELGHVSFNVQYASAERSDLCKYPSAFQKSSKKLSGKGKMKLSGQTNLGQMGCLCLSDGTVKCAPIVAY